MTERTERTGGRTAADRARSQIEHARIDLIAARGYVGDNPAAVRAGIDGALKRTAVALTSAVDAERVTEAARVVVFTADDAERHGWNRPSSIDVLRDAIGDLADALGIERDYIGSHTGLTR